MWRTIGGILAGAVIAVVTVSVLESLGHLIYPPPEGVDLKNPEDLAGIMHSIPLGAKIAVVVAWFCGALFGGLAANWIARRPWPAFFVAALILAGGIATLVMIPHPLWMQGAAVLLPVLAGAIAFALSRRSA